MLFTVVEARDGRAVLESEDRNVTMILEGAQGIALDQKYGLIDCNPFEDEIPPPAVGPPPNPPGSLGSALEAAEDAADSALIAETLAKSDERVPFERVKADLGLAEALEEV